MPFSTVNDPAPGPTGGKRLARNAARHLAGQVVPRATAFAATPALVRGLGTDRLGVLTLAWGVPGYFSLFDLGPGRARTKLAAHDLGLGRRDRIPGLIGTALVLITGPGAVVGASAAASAVWLTGGALRFTGPLRGEGLQALYLLVGSLPFVTGAAGLRGVPEAYQEVRSASALRTALGLATYPSPLLDIPASRSLVPVVAVLVALPLSLEIRILISTASLAARALIAWAVVLGAGDRSACVARSHGVWNHASRNRGRVGVVGLRGG